MVKIFNSAIGEKNKSWYVNNTFDLTLGKEIYKKALENPDFLATIENLEDKLYNEEFDYMFREIYKQKTGKDIDFDPLYFLSPYKEPTGTKLDYDNPNFEAIILEKYPKITKRFW